ncbi:MAG: aminotransferase class V-fold PLP-dependent enzyme [Nitrospirae bacterium]|nr:aminotransferase class V-fold PLP-dependent enzyme [Nitrospirota bacterium]
MIYLDNAATSHPKPEAVYRRVDDVLRHASANPGRAGHQMAVEADRAIFEARESVARLFNIKHPDRIIFTPNATAALNLAIKGLLKPGEHCVTTAMEHNSVTRPLKFLAQLGAEVDKVQPSPKGVTDPFSIKAAIKTNTTLVAVTHASNVIGTITPIGEIIEAAHARNVPVLLDAAQTAGSVNIDVEGLGLDLLACPGHKCLYGPQGTGFLYIAPSVRLKPILYGGTGSRSDMDTMPDFLPDRYEAGTLNTPGIAGLGAGCEFIVSEGIARIRSHEVALCKRLMEGLAGVPGMKLYGVDDPWARASVVSFNIIGNVEGMDPASVGDRLDSEFGIAVRVGIHCAPDAHKTMGSYPTGAVRMSPGYFNTAEDIDKAVEAVAEIARGAR